MDKYKNLKVDCHSVQQLRWGKFIDKLLFLNRCNQIYFSVNKIIAIENF